MKHLGFSPQTLQPLTPRRDYAAEERVQIYVKEVDGASTGQGSLFYWKRNFLLCFLSRQRNTAQALVDGGYRLG